MTDTKTFKDVLNQLATDPTLHTSNLYVLSRMDTECLAAFKAIWPTIPVERRQDIMRELLEIVEINFEVDFDPIFLLALGDKDARVRATAIRSLWEHDSPSLIPPLIHLLKTDDTVIVREAAASALGKFLYLSELEELDQSQGFLVEEALFETIHHSSEDVDVRRRAIESIAYSSQPRIINIIEAAYYDDNQRMQISAIFAMGRNADRRWVTRVIDTLDSDSPEIRFEAARACGELEARGAVSRLVKLLAEDEDPEVQQMILWALGRIGGDTARQVLETYLDHDNEALVWAAEDSLDELNLFDDSLMLFDFDEDEIEIYEGDWPDFHEDEDAFDSHNSRNGNGH